MLTANSFELHCMFKMVLVGLNWSLSLAKLFVSCFTL